jgi:hypothetical protein
MLNIPAALSTKYSLLLNKKSVPNSLYNNYKMWLRYYLDFCHKYCHRYADRESLKHFMIKLHEKHQSLAMQEEAAQAVSLYYEMLGHSDVRTTMIYTHTIKSQTVKEVKSPLDF